MSSKLSRDYPYLNPGGKIDFTTLSDEELLAELKKSPDFEKFVFPTAWHKKFPDLPKADCSDPKTFIKESPWMKRHYITYEGRGKVVDIEPKPGGVRPVLPAPDTTIVTVLENNFSDAPKYENADEHPEDSPETSANSTESTETKSQE